MAIDLELGLDTFGDVTSDAGGALLSHAQVIRNVIDYRMSLADAVSAPRIHYQALPDVLKYDSLGFSSETVSALKRMGYSVLPVRSIGAEVTGIMRVHGGYQGFDDPREKGGGATGY